MRRLLDDMIRWFASRCAIALAAAVLPLGCDARPQPFVPFTAIGQRVDNADVTSACADVGGSDGLRVCWNAEKGQVIPLGWQCEAGTCVTKRRLPKRAAESPMGWRCNGQGDERTCQDRARSADVFRCNDRRCEQRHPRLPDSGEWTCADAAGAVLCSGGEPAAGVLPGKTAPGFACGIRRGPRGPSDPNERVCVDLSPDFPDGRAENWRCHFDHDRGIRRICRRVDGEPLLGNSCDSAHPCVDGAHCVGQRCVAPAPAPECFLDADCPSDACRFGMCRGEGP